MDKPQSLSVKDYLIRKMAISLMVHEKVIEAVISNQFNEANLAMRKNDSVEISGFGKFYFNEKKAKKRLEDLVRKKNLMLEFLASAETSEQKKRSSQVTLEKTEALINLLKTKTTYEDQLLSDIRGVEE